MSGRAVRLGAAAVLGLCALPVARASALPSSCRVVTDARGDAWLVDFGGVRSPSSPVLDIVGGDFATGDRTVVATLRMASLAFDPHAAPSARYVVMFDVGQRGFYAFTMVRDARGSTTYSFYRRPYLDLLDRLYTGRDNTYFPVTGSVDPRTSTIRWVAQRRHVAELAGRPRQTFDIEASTGNPSVSDADAAEGRRYVDRTRSCLRPA